MQTSTASKTEKQIMRGELTAGDASPAAGELGVYCGDEGEY